MRLCTGKKHAERWPEFDREMENLGVHAKHSVTSTPLPSALIPTHYIIYIVILCVCVCVCVCGKRWNVIWNRCVCVCVCVRTRLRYSGGIRPMDDKKRFGENFGDCSPKSSGNRSDNEWKYIIIYQHAIPQTWNF